MTRPTEVRSLSEPFRAGGKCALGAVLLLGSLSCTAEVRGFFAPGTTGAGILVAAPVQLDLRVMAGQPNLPASTVAITPGDAEPVNGLTVGTVQYSGVTGWLGAAVSANTAPATLTVNVANSQLTPGYYSATVPVISTSSGNSPQNVIVTLIVDSVRVLHLSTDSVRFTATAGGASPGGVSIQVTNTGGGSLTGMSLGTVQYTPTGQTGWLTATLGATTTPTTVQLQAAVGALAVGAYSAKVPVLASGGVRDTIRVVLDVSAAVVVPRITMVQDSLRFDATTGGNDPAQQVVTVSNTGGGTLTALTRSITYGSGGSGWLTATLGSTTGPTTLTLQPQTANLATGLYRATVIVTDPAATNSDSVRVVFRLTAPPRIALSTAAVNFTAASGGANPAVKGVTVTNGGGGSLTGLQLGSIAYGGGQPTGWLTATINSTTAPATITLSARVGTLQAGQYTAIVPVTSALGIPSQTIDVTFSLSGGSGAIVGLLGLNQTGFTDSVLRQQVVVRVLNAASAPVAGVAVAWTAGQGGSTLNSTTVTDANGEVRTSWRLGPNPGAQTLVASTSGITPLTINATGSSAGGSGANPGEPAGFVLLADRRFDAKVESGWLDRGDWQFTIEQDANAPFSAPNVGQALFNQGRIGGTGPINTMRAVGQYNKKQIYLSFYFKLSSNWVGAPSNGINKVLHIWINGGSVVVFSAQGQSGNAITPQMRLQNIEADTRGISFNLNPNLVPSVRLIRGQWHRVEILLKSNTPGVQDGDVAWWVDGVKVADWANVGFISSTNTTPGAVNWQQVSWNPTWGAPIDVVPADQYMQIDQFYISGF